MKKIIIIIILVPVIILLGFYLTNKYVHISTLNSFPKYKLIDNEEVLMDLNYNNYNYIITKYYDNTSSWSHINFLLKENNKYYLLKNIKKCDVEKNHVKSMNNQLYVHCVGKNDNTIDKYIFDKLNIKYEKLLFNMDKAYVSNVHFIIESVNDDYIYISDALEMEAKCSFKTRKCLSLNVNLNE